MNALRTDRNYGIDFLRFVLMYMVCMLHVLGQGGILSACQKGTVKYKMFWMIEVLSYCAVDGYAIISGYTARFKKQKFEKIIEMWFQVFFYSFVITLICTVAGLNSQGGQDIIKCVMPVTFNKYWYFTAYFVLFLPFRL